MILCVREYFRLTLLPHDDLREIPLRSCRSMSFCLTKRCRPLLPKTILPRQLFWCATVLIVGCVGSRRPLKCRCVGATLASAAVVMERLDEKRNTVVFHTLSGPLTVSRTNTDYVMNFPARSSEPISSVPGLADALGVVPVEVVANAFNYMALVESEQILRELVPDPFCDDWQPFQRRRTLSWLATLQAFWRSAKSRQFNLSIGDHSLCHGASVRTNSLLR